MMSISTVLFTGIGLFACLTAGVSGQVVQLRSGDVLLGKVDAHEDGLTVVRFDNGGVLDLTWDQLSNESAGRIKALFNLSVEDEDQAMVTAERLRYELAGGGVDEVVGRVVDENDTTITVRRLGVNYPIRRDQVRRRSTVEVPAVDVFTRDEFYNEKLVEIAPGDDADKHIKLADELVRVGDYDRAKDHLDRARELGGGRQPNLLAGKIKRLKLFRESAAEREFLDRIKIALARGDFKKGKGLIEDFERKHSKSKLQGEFLRVKDRFDKARQRYLTVRTTELWYKAMFPVARKKAVESGVTFEDARDYAESEMGQDIRAKVQKALGIPAEEVDVLWQQRFDYRGGPRAQRYSYGVGSWTLGSDAIVKGTKLEAGHAVEQESAVDRQKRRTREKIRRALDRQRRAAARNRGPSHDKDTPGEWWKKATADEKTVWLRAYYVEHGGDLRVENASISKSCDECGGEGKTTSFGLSGKRQRVECWLCHGTRFWRAIRAR